MSSSTSPAFNIYRDQRNKCEIYRYPRNKVEDDVWDGEIDEPAPPPYVVLVQGPPNVGKSLLIKSLVKHFTMEHIMNDIQGPITIPTGDKRRVQFVECPDDINGMIDAAKYADLVLLLVDASYGFEAETFEFFNLLRVHGLPKVMGVLTHLDQLEGEMELMETIERLQYHFWTEICEGATISYLSGPDDYELYKMLEVQKLAQAISMLRFHTPSWRAKHPYVLVDRFEDVTPLEKLQKDANCNRNISLYGYLRGCNIKSGTKVHMAGVGDFRLASVTSLVDPFPLASEMEDEENLVDITHMDMGSFRTGTYLRLEVHDVPYRMVENLNPCHPILVGGISLEEEHVGYTQVRLKQHSWHMKPLKSCDSVTVSAGWRRYQTKPIYAREIDNGRHQMLKFTPEHNHCLAMFWGPLAPPLTRIAVLQSNKGAFRIAAEAVVLDPKPDRKIMKESRQKGTPLKITERKALIKFELEDINVAEFIGAPIRTLDGIRGQVKEVAKREGIAKCTFKKRICMSDVVFMRMLRQAEAPRFFNSLSVPPEPREEQRRGVEIMDGDARPRIATTIALVRNKVGTYVAADGGAFDSLTNECIDENRDKIFEVCDNLFAAPSGCENWYKPIIKYCRSAGEVLENRKAVRLGLGLGLTAKECADYAESTFRTEYRDLPEKMKRGHHGFDLRREPCGIAFAQFKGEGGEVFYAGRDSTGDIEKIRLLGHSELPDYYDEDVMRTILCHGSGGPFADYILRQRERRLRKGTRQNKHLNHILKAMLWACHKDPHSKGLIQVCLLRDTGYTELYKEQFETLKERFPGWLDRQKRRDSKLKQYRLRWMLRKIHRVNHRISPMLYSC